MLIAPIRHWILAPWADPQSVLAPEGRLGPDVGAPWAPGPAYQVLGTKYLVPSTWYQVRGFQSRTRMIQDKTNSLHFPIPMPGI